MRQGDRSKTIGLFAVLSIALMLSASFVSAETSDAGDPLAWEGEDIASLGDFYSYLVIFEFAGEQAETIYYGLYDSDSELLGEYDSYHFEYTFSDKGTYYLIQTVTNPSGSSTQWYSLNIVGYPIITFDTDGGSPVDAIQQPAFRVVADAPEDPVKDNCTFGGWFEDQAFEKEWSWETEVVKSMTLYAKWIQDPTITFDSNGGSDVEEIIIGDGSAADMPTDPTRDGYTFDGWYLDSEFTQAYDWDSAVTSSFTLYAKWIQIFTITFDSNGGTPVADSDVEGGSSATIPSSPSRSGYTFQGWYSDSELTQTYDWDSAVTSDLTLYAKWKSVSSGSGGGSGGGSSTVTYTVRFETNGGSSVSSIKVEKGKVAVKPTDPVKDGSRFDGWYTDSELTQPYDWSSKVTKSITLYAKWVQFFTITFDSNGGSSVVSITVEEGSVISVKPADPVREGYTFQGWYSDWNSYDWRMPIMSDVVLCAGWIEDVPPAATDEAIVEDGTDGMIVPMLLILIIVLIAAMIVLMVRSRKYGGMR